MLYCSMTTPLPTLSACSQRSYPRKYSILYSSTSPPQMAYIYLLSFPHRWRYRPFPFSLPLNSQTYISRQQTNMAASRTATRPGDVRSATLFLGRGPPKNTYSGPFHTPHPKYIRRGRTLPYRNPWASADPLPWGSSGAIAHPPLWGSHGAIAHPQPKGSSGAIAHPQPWGSTGAIAHSQHWGHRGAIAHPPLWESHGAIVHPHIGKQWSHSPSPTLGKPWSHCPSPHWGSSGAIAHHQPRGLHKGDPTYGSRATHPPHWGVKTDGA
jgi:hypothetical protein